VGAERPDQQRDHGDQGQAQPAGEQVGEAATGQQAGDQPEDGSERQQHGRERGPAPVAGPREGT